MLASPRVEAAEPEPEMLASPRVEPEQHLAGGMDAVALVRAHEERGGTSEPEPEPEPQPEPEPEEGEWRSELATAKSRQELAAQGRARAAVAHIETAKAHLVAAATADRHNMGAPQYALAIQSLQTALRVDPDAEADSPRGPAWTRGLSAPELLQEAQERLAQRQRERDDAAVASASSGAAGLLERARSAVSWLQMGAGAVVFDAPEPCELTVPPAEPMRGHITVTTALEFCQADPAERTAASSLKSLLKSSGGGASGARSLTIPLTAIVNCFERRAAVAVDADAPPIALPPGEGGGEGEDGAEPRADGYTEAPQELRTVVVAYSAGGQPSSATQLEVSLTLSAAAAEALLARLEPLVEQVHAARLLERGCAGPDSSDSTTVYERVYFQCEIDGQPALDSGKMTLSTQQSAGAASCALSFEGSFHSVAVSVGGSGSGELLLARVREDVDLIRGMQTLHVVHSPREASESEAVEWLLEPDEAAALAAELAPFVGPRAAVQERLATAAARRERARACHAEVEALLESVPPVVEAATQMGEAGSYAMASTMLTLELFKMHRVVSQWQRLAPQTLDPDAEGQQQEDVGTQFAFESAEEKDAEALGYAFGNAGRLEARFSHSARNQMQVWGMMSEHVHGGDSWTAPALQVLQGGLVSRYKCWEPALVLDSFPLAAVVDVRRAVTTAKSALEVMATLGLDGTASKMPDHVMIVRLLQHEIATVWDSATALLLGGAEQQAEDGRAVSAGGRDEPVRSVGVGRELTDRTNELFARVSEEGDWSAELRAEANRLAQSHLEHGEATAASAAEADRYGLGGPQWARAADAFRNALRLRPQDDRWSEDREAGCAARALAEAEAASEAAAGPGGHAADSYGVVERVLRAPDAASYDIWAAVLTPVATDVFAVQSFPCEDVELHLYRVDRTGGGGRGHWGGGGAGHSPRSSSQPRAPREDRGWVTRTCRLFPSTITVHEEAAVAAAEDGLGFGKAIGGGVELCQILKGSVHVVPAASAPREHYGRVGAVLSMVVVTPAVDDGEGHFTSGSQREVCLASSDEVAIAQWEKVVLEQLDKIVEEPADDGDGEGGDGAEVGLDLFLDLEPNPSVAAPVVESLASEEGE